MHVKSAIQLLRTEVLTGALLHSGEKIFKFVCIRIGFHNSLHLSLRLILSRTFLFNQMLARNGYFLDGMLIFWFAFFLPNSLLQI